MRVLVTGGAGYIGSHTVVQLLEQDHDVLVYDNFSNSSPEALRRVSDLTGKMFETRQGDIRDGALLEATFADFRPEAVIHFAGLKAVGESQVIPLEYYSNNVTGSLLLLAAMRKYNCRRLVFSSSATVYGDSRQQPVDETQPAAPTNPYGRTKYFIEEVIRDWCNSWDEAGAVLLRYFNPAGAHPSGRIGEDPNGIPNNLLPYVSQVAVGRRDQVAVFGDDYDTRDGTGERDYIHVMDLASAHLAALHFSTKSEGAQAINLGTGQGTTVLEMIDAFVTASGQDIPYEIVPRRDGDVASVRACVENAQTLLGWKAEYGLAEMCQSAWSWQKGNPDGYGS